MKEIQNKVLTRFLQYVKVDTESVPDQETIPSSEKQKDLGKRLAEELKEFGASDVRMDEHGYVYAKLPSTMKRKNTVPVLGFIAHMDTSPAVKGADVNPQITRNYDGEDIELGAGYTLRASEFPELKRYIGQDIITTDGTTLLGADDKAGVAEIMTMAEYLLRNPQIEHGEISIGFTPDEEVGRGTDFFDVEGFGAQFAYTVDGGGLGEIEYENFNAASAKVTIHGKSIHPGSAKGQMKNAILMGMEFQSMLPVVENPMYTEGYEGFFHLDEMDGNVEEAHLFYIIRDHDKSKFEEKKVMFLRIVSYLNEKYGQGSIEAELKDSYYNMKEQIIPHMHLIENAERAMRECDVKPQILPIRGGTDGARLSYKGLPCPNLCTGGYNYHGRYEYIPAQSLGKVVEILLKIIALYSQNESFSVNPV